MTVNTDTYIDVMLDLETLGTKPGCKILSLSAVTFRQDVRETQQVFDTTITVSSQPRLVVEQDTVAWWQRQDEQVRKAVFNNPNAKHIREALLTFNDWLKTLGKIPRIWGNGASFDAPVLRAAFELENIEPGWNFRDERCYRTLSSEFGFMATDVEFVGMKHTSLADAKYQAARAEIILARLADRR
jgi:hypothetical protein